MAGHGLDPHERPPECIRVVYKKYRRMSPRALQQDRDILDFGTGLTEPQRGKVTPLSRLDPMLLADAFRDFELHSSADGHKEHEPPTTREVAPSSPPTPISVYEHADVPGLLIIPGLLPAPTQLSLLTRLLHRDLSNPSHRTNVHAHHVLSYPSCSSGVAAQHQPASFFSLPFGHPPFAPRDPASHPPLPVDRFLRKSLRWVTLGGQYDWTAKRYPAPSQGPSHRAMARPSSPSSSSIDLTRPDFPPDIAGLLRSLFPLTTPHAAIVNVYSPGDVLSPHRDVSENVGNGLVSCSLGCSGVFLVSGRAGANEHERASAPRYVLIRLRSGDAIYMSGSARWAWHAIPAVEAGTCPDYLQHWPASAAERGTGEAEESPDDRWKGWMGTKRVNLNVRQMD